MRKGTWRDLRPEIALVWRLSLPAILTQITTIVMQYIDSAMVGARGANASAAIGLVASSTWLFGGLTSAVAAGFYVQVAHQIGAENDAEARNVVRHALLSKPLPGLLGGGAEQHRDAAAYFLVFALALPFQQLNALCSGFLQCSGDMVTPSILNAVMCALDVAFNTLFIPRYGVLGAGLGTGLACAVISLVMAWRCCFCNAALRLRRKETGRFESEILRKALKIGLPVAVQEAAMCGAQVAATTIIAPLGAVAIAAHSFAVTAESLCYMPGYGIGAAATTLVGRNIGAGKHAEAKRCGNICTAMGGVFMGVTGAVMMLICPLVFRMLTPDAEVRTLAAQVLRIGLLAEPLYGVSIVAAGALRGAGDTLVPSLMNLASIWGVRLGLALVLTPRFGLRGMWTAMAVELCVRGLLMLLRQRTTKYYEHSVVQTGEAAPICEEA